MRFVLQTLAAILVVIAGFCNGQTPEPVQCIRKNVCKDATEKPFACATIQKECCARADGTLALVESPRGTLCCHGAGAVYRMNAQACNNGTIVDVGRYEKMCGLSKRYNSQTQDCCTSNEGQSEVYQKSVQGQKQCCGKDYIEIGQKECCVGVTYDPAAQCCDGGEVVERSTFGCAAQPSLVECNDGEDCCAGTRILNLDTHLCHKGQIYMKNAPDHNSMCLFLRNGSKQLASYNDVTQRCGLEGPIVLPAGKGLCGGVALYNLATELCCSGEVSPNKSRRNGWRCCRGSPYAHKKGDSNCPSPSAPSLPRPACSRLSHKKCTQHSVERRLKKNMLRGAYVLALTVSKEKDSNETHRFYKVKTVKQIIGSGGTKTMVIPRMLKVLGVPKCGCHGPLETDTKYLLITKVKVKKSKRMTVHGMSYDIVRADAPSVISRLFNL